MKKRKYVWILVGVTTLLTAGCYRRPLEDEFSIKARIPVKIYWDRADIAPKNATVMFYRENGTLYKEWTTSSQKEFAEGKADLEEGKYTVVAFNELRNQIDYVRMRGWENFATFEAYATENRNPLYAFLLNEDADAQVMEPGILAACVSSITVTPEMIRKSGYGAPPEALDGMPEEFYALTSLHPERKTALAHIKVHVTAINNALMPAVAELRNMASGYLFAADKNTLSPVTAQFRMSNRVYNNGSLRDGTISASVATFGVPGERFYIEDTPDASFFLDIAFMLTDADHTIVEIGSDITDIMEIRVDDKRFVTIDVELEVGPLPDVKPVGGDSGFNTDLADWDKVIIPLK